MESAAYDPSDLIDDREVSRAEDDELSHRQFARQLTDVALGVRTPANIALYGPWGSGKSGIANLVKANINDANKGKPSTSRYRYARFDAFKYAENPLRRNFINAVAHELGISDDKFSKDLYADKATTDVSLTGKAAARIVGIFLIVLTAVAVFLLGCVALIAWIGDGDFGKAFRDLSLKALAASIVPSALLTTLIGLFGSAFQVKRNVTRPESDEEFEALLRDLVTRSKAERLVIFVDELDRCSPSEVVETLDAIRTFLGIDKCVFIIAADQNVLEQALTQQTRQDTPSDATNPYYSAGSAYLDKVFQYQVSLPPLMPQSITKFAARIVESRTTGVWADVDVERIASILIPSHVVSPRRVKHLMNAFALTYRTAQSRFESGQLLDSPQDSADSLAKLTCIRVEFPRFAGHLQADPDLIQKILEQSAAKDRTGDGDDKTEQSIVDGYVEGTEETATLISSTDGEPAPTTGRDQVIRKQGRDLLNYLNRTRTVLGPTRDLLFMQTKGAIVGLPGAISERLEKAGLDNDVAGAQNVLEDLSDIEREAAFQLFAQQAQHEVGLDSENNARILLSLLATEHVVMGPSPDQAADVIASIEQGLTPRPSQTGNVVDESTFAGAWLIGIAGDGDGARVLRTSVLQLLRADASVSSGIVLRHATIAVNTNAQAVADIVSSRLVSEASEDFGVELSDLEPRAFVAILQASAPGVRRRLQLVTTDWKDEQKRIETEAAAAAAAPASTRRAIEAAAAEEEEEPSEDLLDPAVVVATLLTLVEHVAPFDDRAAYWLVEIVLAVDTFEARNAVEALLPSLPSAKDRTAIAALLRSCQVRSADDWPKWLNAVDSASLLPFHVADLKRLLTIVWARLDADKPLGTATFTAAIDSLSRLLDVVESSTKPTLTEEVTESLNATVDDTPSVAHRVALLGVLDVLAARGLVDPRQVLEAHVASVSETLRTAEIDADELTPDVVSYVQLAVGFANEPPSQAWIRAGSDLLVLASALDESPWLPEPTATQLRLQTQAAIKHLDIEAPSSVGPNAEHMRLLLASHGEEAYAAAAYWLDAQSPSASDTRVALRTFIRSGRIPPKISLAVDILRGGWSEEEQVNFLRPSIEGEALDVPSAATLRLLGYEEVPEPYVAEILVTRFKRTTNNTDRRKVLDLWAARKFKSPGSHKSMVEGVAIPMLKLDSKGENEQASTMVLIALDAVNHRFAPALRAPLGAAIKVSADHHPAVRTRAGKVLPKLGYGKKSLGFLKGSTVDYSG